MAGLADLFGMGDSGGMFGGGAGGLYGDLLTPEMKQQMAFRGLMAAAGALGQAAMPSRMPVPIGAALGSAAAAMASAQDQGLENALKTALTGGKLQELKSQIAARAAGTRDLADVAKMMGGLNAPATPSGAPQPLIPAPVAPGADTLGTGGTPAKAVSTMTADATMDPVQRAFLDSIAGPESSGAYNIRYTPGGGATFAGYDAHPNIPEPGPQGPSTAAGRYQIVNSTWKPLAGQLGLSDFSPVSQDQAAWTLASDTYQKSTGRDLLADLKAGKMDQIPSALGGQWPTIRKALPAFAANLAKYGQAGTALTDEGVLPPVPNFSGAMAGNQGPAYAPPVAPTVAFGAPDTVVAGAGPQQSSAMRAAAQGAGQPTPTKTHGGYVDGVWYPNIDAWNIAMDKAAVAAEPSMLPSAATAPAPPSAPPPTPAAPIQAPALPAAAALAPTPPPASPDAARLQTMLQALALKNAAMGLAGDKQPYNSLIGVLQGSPQYKAALEAAGEYAKRSTGLPFIAPETTAKAGAEQPFLLERDRLKAELDRRNALAQLGVNLDANGVNVPAPGFQDVTAALEGAKEKEKELAKAGLDIVTVPRVDPATGLMTNIRMSRAALAQQLAAQPQAPNPAAAPPVAPAPVAPGAPAVAPQVPQGGAMVPGGAMLPIGAEPAGIGQVPAGQQLVMTPNGPAFKDVPGSATARATEQRDQSLKQSTDIVTQDIDRALQLSRNVAGVLPTTGPAGAAFKPVPGTAAHDLQEILIGIRANTGFAELNKMRQQSPTGGALGPVSDMENKLLQSTLGSLEQSQSQAQFEENLKRLHNVYMDVVHGTPEKLDAEVKAGKITAAQRQQMLDKRYDLAPAVPSGVPVTKEQYDKLPPGTMFIAPDGTRRIKPGAP